MEKPKGRNVFVLTFSQKNNAINYSKLFKYVCWKHLSGMHNFVFYKELFCVPFGSVSLLIRMMFN